MSCKNGTNWICDQSCEQTLTDGEIKTLTDEEIDALTDEEINTLKDEKINELTERAKYTDGCGVKYTDTTRKLREHASQHVNCADKQANT